MEEKLIIDYITNGILVTRSNGIKIFYQTWDVLLTEEFYAAFDVVEGDNKILTLRLEDSK